MPLFTKTASGIYLAHNATITGDVKIGGQSSLWFNAVVRGDVAPISIGQRVNIQDGAIVHCDTDEPNVIEDEVSIAHGAIVHGKFVGKGTLVGMHATVLSRTKIGSQCLIAAGAVVTPDTEIPDRSLVAGVPAKIVRPVNEKELKYLAWLTGRYIDLAERYVRGEITNAEVGTRNAE